MKRYNFLLIVFSILIFNGCGEIDKFISKNKFFPHNNSENKVLEKRKNKKENFNENNEKNLEYPSETENKTSINFHLEKNSSEKNVSLKVSDLNETLKALNNLNINIQTKTIKLKKGNLLLVNLGPIVNFETNKFNIRNRYKSKIDKIINILKKNNKFILIVGHTDSVGSDIYNQKLSELRAREVYNYFISKGINKKRIDYIGYGEEQPITTNATSEGRAKNRRVELLISKDENLSNYFLKIREINKMYLNNHDVKMAGKVVITKKGWSKHLNETEIKKLEHKFSKPKREELIPHFKNREFQINLRKRELIFKGAK
jgi:outer membrane protein OmpA-like peptidoglycan-associated protein